VVQHGSKSKSEKHVVRQLGGAGYYRYRHLMGARQQAMMIATVRAGMHQGRRYRCRKLQLRGKRSNATVERQAGRGDADQVEIADLPEDVQERAVEIGVIHFFRRASPRGRQAQTDGPQNEVVPSNRQRLIWAVAVPSKCWPTPG